MDAESGELFYGGGENWQLEAPFPFSEMVFSGPEKPLQDWLVDPGCANHDSESEDVLHGVDPNEVFPSGPATASADHSSESDSGISEDPVPENPVTVATGATPATIYQVVYDISGLRGVKTEPGPENVISIEFDEWSSQVLFSDSCIVNELPLVTAAARLDSGLFAIDPPSPDGALMFPDLQLTEEEQKLLTLEGVSLPNNLPLTKAEERILKRVRRKIRNKQSAQDSRRRRKEYVDGLESRAAACSAQNKELQRTVERLEKHNMSLLSQVRQLQSLIKQTVSKGAQTSTCLLIILVSLSLIILPSFSPFRRNPSLDESDYSPKGVISRNILTDSASSQSASEEVEDSSSSPPSSSDLGQSEGLMEGKEAKESMKDPENPDSATIAVQKEGNSSAAVAGETEVTVLGLKVPPVAVAGNGGSDAPKPAHADEM